EWRWFYECECGASVREPDAAVELCANALDIRDRERDDVLPRAHGEEPEAWLGALGHDDDIVCGGRPHGVVGGGSGESNPSALGRRSGGREHGRQGSPFR